MGKISDEPVANRQKVHVTERSLLVAHGQSKRLADMRKKIQPENPLESGQHGGMQGVQLLTGLKSEVAAELIKARKLIDDSINEIMRSFPEGKKNRLFSFKFGSVDAIKTMSIKIAFKALGIDDNSVKLKLLDGMDYHGNDVKRHSD
jgi:hypothetical protein